MLICTLESCTDTGTIGLVLDGVVLAEAAFPSRYTLARRMLTRLDWLLGEVGAGKHDIEAISVSQGPGSFTGVRIGMAAGKMLADGLKIPLACIPTLEALAYPFRELSSCLLAPVINARRQQVYTAIFRAGEQGLERLTPDMLLSAEPFHLLLNEHIPADMQVALIGQTEGLPEAFRQDAPRPIAAIRSLVTPHALANLAMERLARGESDDPVTCTPIYLRSAAD